MEAWLRDEMFKILRHATRTTSYVLMLKGAFTGSLVMLAVFGISVPILGPSLGIEPSDLNGGIMASVGAIGGAIIAARA